MFGGLTQDTIAQLRASMYSGMGFGGGGLFKDATAGGITTGLGLAWYDLEAEAKDLYPALSPIINELPRVGLTGVGFGNAANWKAIVNINNSQVFPGVSEGKRGGQIQFQERDLVATYKGLGLEDFVNFEAEYAAQGYDDVLGRASRSLLKAMKVSEEQMVLWGNNSLAGGTMGTPTVVDNGGSGTALTATVQTVKCVALTPYGLLLAGGLQPATNAAVTQAVVDQTVRTNADGSTDTINGGHSIISAAGTVTPTAAHGIKATCVGKAGAAAYAWYVGVNGGATLYLTAITSIPILVIAAGLGDAPNTGNQQSTFTGNGSDRFQNTLSFDGLITQLLGAANWAKGGIFGQMANLSPAPGGAYSLSLAGAALTGSAGVVNELDAMLLWMWNAYRIWPDELWVSAYQANQITKLALASTTPSYRIDITGKQGEVIAGSLVTSYINKFANGGATRLPIRIHPFMPDSWIFANIKSIADKLPMSNVPAPNRIKARREYYSVAWPVTTRQRQYGVYVDEVLECYAPFAMGLLTDVG